MGLIDRVVRQHALSFFKHLCTMALIDRVAKQPVLWVVRISLVLLGGFLASYHNVFAYPAIADLTPDISSIFAMTVRVFHSLLIFYAAVACMCRYSHPDGDLITLTDLISPLIMCLVLSAFFCFNQWLEHSGVLDSLFGRDNLVTKDSTVHSSESLITRQVRWCSGGPTFQGYGEVKTHCISTEELIKYEGSEEFTLVVTSNYHDKNV